MRNILQKITLRLVLAAWRLRLLRWFFVRRSRTILLVLLLVATTFLLVGPFFGAEIPEASATVASAFLGAMVAVLWSASAAHSERLNEHREAALAIRMMVCDIPPEIETACGLLERANLDLAFERPMRECALGLRKDVQRAIDNLAELQPHLSSFGAVNFVGILDLRRALRELDDALAAALRWNLHDLADSPVCLLEQQQNELKTTLGWLEAI